MRRYPIHNSLLLVGCLLLARVASAASPAVELKEGKLVYQSDEKGNRVPDFSFAGYRAGESPLPLIQVKALVSEPSQDNTQAIQAAIDYVASLEPDENGFRGAVLLAPGEFKVSSAIVLRASGVVLRGSGTGPEGTTIRATGLDRRAVIQVRGVPLRSSGEPITVNSPYVPVNATSLSVADAHRFAVGDTVRVTHPSTKAWVDALGMNDFGGDRHGPSWRPGSRDVHWLRVVTRVEGDELTLDAPLTLALDQTHSTATVTKLDATGLIRNVGVENLRIVSDYDSANPKDEEHAWFGITFDHARDGWARQVTFEHLVGSAIAVWETSSRITVEDCKSLAPVGEIGGTRRRTFFTSGQQVLMQRLYSESGIHDFSVGLAAAGPNAFVQCESVDSLGESGAIDSVACGTLFDRVRIDRQPISLRNRDYQGQGVGWASFNGVLWNCTAAVIRNEKPPTAQNWSFGAHGEFSGNGAWSGSDDDVTPDSLYYAQLAERIGKERSDERAHMNLPAVQGSRAPTLESAAEAIAVSRKPRVTMSEWIDRHTIDYPAPADARMFRGSDARHGTRVAIEPTTPLAVTNGWLTLGGQLAIGKQLSVPWWRGSVRTDDIARAAPALTRFVPGRVGLGLTDDLLAVADGMNADGYVSVFQHPPLWYERRRDDHSRVSRQDGEVVAPFYETPWARSGQGIAADGLSKWDLTKVNPWYFARLRAFAQISQHKKLVLFNGLYMQHSVLEAGAHYADAPWRSANNINPVGIPEPVFFAGDKLIYVAEQFYDVSDPDRAALHRVYMRNVLNELADQPNVVLYLSDEYTGPLAFTQFWLDVVAEWKRETGKDVQVALYATKDVTDAILADSPRAAVVTMLYNRFNNEGDAGWWYQADGTLYAPEGGKNLAPRQWARLLKPKKAGFEQVVRAVREYRRKYPDKPFVYEGPAEFAWAVVLGGGSLAPVPATTDPELLKAIAQMRPTDRGLADEAGSRLEFYSERAEMALGPNAVDIDMKTGEIAQPPGGGLVWIKASK